MGATNSSKTSLSISGVKSAAWMQCSEKAFLPLLPACPCNMTCSRQNGHQDPRLCIGSVRCNIYAHKPWTFHPESCQCSGKCRPVNQNTIPRVDKQPAGKVESLLAGGRDQQVMFVKMDIVSF